MRQTTKKTAEFIGIYLLPIAPDAASKPTRFSALLVMHIAIAQAPAHPAPAASYRPVSATTAIFLIGKEGVMEPGSGAHLQYEFVGSLGVSQFRP